MELAGGRELTPRAETLRKYSSFLLALPLLASSSCSPPPAALIDLEAEKAALHEAADTFHGAAPSMDVETLAAQYASDVLLLPPNGERILGAAGAYDFLAAFAAMPGAAARFEEPRIVDVSRGGDLGYTLGEAEFAFEGPDGKTVIQRVREFHLWKKQDDGSWKIAIDIWNSGTPPPTQGQ